MAYVEGSNGNDNIGVGARPPGVWGSPTNGNDQIEGRGGKDNISGGGGVDFINGGLGQDDLRGDDGDDYLSAGGYGALSEDSITERLNGGTGNDTLVGTASTPLGTISADEVEMRGGSGADRFVVADFGAAYAYSTLDHARDHFGVNYGQDLVVDFNPLEGDKIFLGGRAVAPTPSGLKPLLFMGEASGFTNLPDYREGHDVVQAFWIWDFMFGDKRPGMLVVDLDGDGTIGDGDFVVTVYVGEGTGSGASTMPFSKDWLFKEDFTTFAELKLPSSGNDTLSGTAKADLVDARYGDDSLSGLGGNDTLIGGVGGDTLNGGTGDDSLVGGTESDLYLIDSSGDRVSERGGSGDDTVQSSVGFTLGSGFEDLILTGSAAINGTGNAAANRISGTSAANLLTGGGGDDTLDGDVGNDTLESGSGADSMFGGIGDDLFRNVSLSDEVRENQNAGNDTVEATGSHTLGTNLENLTLVGSAKINGTGNSANNVILGNGASNLLSGQEGNDTLDGGAGADTMAGGIGDDLYRVNSSSDRIRENARAGNDTVETTVSLTLGIDLETLTLVGSGEINGIGNSGYNTINGNGAANLLSGGGGRDFIAGGAGNDALNGDVDNDTLSGGADNDTLDGGTGDDVLSGGAGNDFYRVDSVHDWVSESSGSGIDRVEASVSWVLGGGLENLTLIGSYASDATGNAGDNTIAGNVNDNLILGAAGNDSMTGRDGSDTLDGGSGNDSMKGGAGNDLYRVDSLLDAIREESGSGIDRVESSVSWTLAASIEHLTLVGSAAIDGAGNSGSNIITGNAKSNLLSGASGNDTLYGGGGNDILIGGAAADSLFGEKGRDVFRYTGTGDRGDTITGFVVADDQIEISRSGFGGVLSGNRLQAGNFASNLSGSATGASAQFVYETDTGNLFWDQDGIGAGASVLIATFVGRPHLTASDFDLIV